MKRHAGVALAFALFLVAASGSPADAGKPRRALPDLTISAISAPSSTSPGLTIVVSNSILNQGQATSLSFSMSYYLSTTASKTSSSPLLGVQNVGALPAGTSVTIVTSLAIPSSTASGTFYVVGVAGAGGTNHVIAGNKALDPNIPSGLGDVGIYVWNRYTGPCAGHSVTGDEGEQSPAGRSLQQLLEQWELRDGQLARQPLGERSPHVADA